METMKLSSDGSRKRKLEPLSESSCETDSIFALLMASLSSPNSTPETVSLVTKCLNRLRFFLSLTPSRILPVNILSIMPLLLKSRSSAIACLGAEFVGAASLCSLELNQQIAGDKGTVTALVSLLVKTKRRISMAACDAVLDLCITSFGRKRLLELSALEVLMSSLLQVPSSSVSVLLCASPDSDVPCHKIGFEKDELLALLLDATVTLLNTCCSIELERIPRELVEGSLQFWKCLWGKVHDEVVLNRVLRSNEATQFYMSDATVNNLAESLSRLSARVLTISPSTLRSTLWSLEGTTFIDFMSNHWEVSPTFVGRLSDASTEDIFLRSVKHPSEMQGSLPFSVSSLLKSLSSCPPIASDEADILNFLKEVRQSLGCPLIYEQDIRVLRVDKQTNREVHLFGEGSDNFTETPYVLFVDDIQKCEEAFKEGYTIALRGMEFRFSSIASIACELASLFGQPSVGANLYLTPPNSQGLAGHYDDHCVFVCQILGSKRWKISNEPIVKLPRLYAPCDTVSVENSLVSACQNLELKEGDVLYIPRGYAHEACTDDVVSDGSVAFSLHLTLAVEVERPFEWEGFVHVALYCWRQNKMQRRCTSAESLDISLHNTAIDLLHLSIISIGGSDPNFRRACLVASTWLKIDQKGTFLSLIDTIRKESKYWEALGMVESSTLNKEDPFRGIQWLQFLDPGWNAAEEVENLLETCRRRRDVAEAALMEARDEFCNEVVFEDCVESYKGLVERYRRVRTEYMSGMLALHPGLLRNRKIEEFFH